MSSEYKINVNPKVKLKIKNLLINENFIKLLNNKENLDFDDINNFNSKMFLNDIEYRKNIIKDSDILDCIIKKIAFNYCGNLDSYDGFLDFSIIDQTFGDGLARCSVTDYKNSFYISNDFLGFETDSKNIWEKFVNKISNDFCNDCDYKENCKDKPKINTKDMSFCSCKKPINLEQEFEYLNPNIEDYDIYTNYYTGE